MNEEEFRDIICTRIGKFLDDIYKVEIGKKLLYKVIVDEDMEYLPASPSSPKKGEYAFETDLAIVKGSIPLVIIETKYGGFSTHDILTYSTKAIKHKEIYPYLRYGLLVGDKPNITNKFFLHNVGFDFAIAMKTLSTDNINQLKSIIETQITSAELLLSIMNDKKGKGVATFHSVIYRT